MISKLLYIILKIGALTGVKIVYTLQCMGQSRSTRDWIDQECTMATKCGRKTSDRSITNCMGQRSVRRSNMPMTTRVGRKNPWPTCITPLGQRLCWVSRGQAEVKLLRNTPWIPNLVGKPLTRVTCIAGGKGYAGISPWYAGENPWPEWHALLGARVMPG